MILINFRYFRMLNDKLTGVEDSRRDDVLFSRSPDKGGRSELSRAYMFIECGILSRKRRNR